MTNSLDKMLELTTGENKKRLLALVQSDNRVSDETDFSTLTDPDLDGAEASAKAYADKLNKGYAGRKLYDLTDDDKSIRLQVQEFLKHRKQYLSEKTK